MPERKRPSQEATNHTLRAQKVFQLLILGNTLLETGRYNEALETLKKAIEIDPHIATMHVHLASVLRALKRFEESLNACQRALELNPSSAPAFYELGVTLTSMHRSDEALSTFDQALELDPTFLKAQNGRGINLGKLGRHEEALKAFELALAGDPDEVIVHFNRAGALRALGRYLEAIAEYEYCLQKNYDVLQISMEITALSAIVYDIKRAEIDYATRVRDLGGNGNEDDFWFILKQEIEEEIFYHILLTKEKARRREDGYDQVANMLDHVLNLNPINLIFGGGFLVSIFKKQVDVRYDDHHRRQSLKIVNTLNGKTWDAESISEFADELSETITTRFAELLPRLSQQGMFTFIKYCLQKLFAFQDVGKSTLLVDEQLLFNLINGEGKDVQLELAITPEDAVDIHVWAKAHPTISSELILKSGLMVDGKKYVHPQNPANPLNYFVPSTLEEVKRLGYIEG